jgi:hypothetical protein
MLFVFEADHVPVDTNNISDNPNVNEHKESHEVSSDDQEETKLDTIEIHQDNNQEVLETGKDANVIVQENEHGYLSSQPGINDNQAHSHSGNHEHSQHSYDVNHGHSHDVNHGHTHGHGHSHG